jgi:SAM-dependent methyltransferase
MGNDPHSSKQEVDALIEQIRQAARLQHAMPVRDRANGSSDPSLTSASGVLDGYLAELVRRSHPRTELPVRFRRFPLSIAAVGRIALRLYNLLTKEQRANNVLLRDALQALQATLNRNELALRETALLTSYVRALLMHGRSGRASGARPDSATPDEAATEPATGLDSFFAALGDEFRGSPDLIKDRLRVYLPIIRAAAMTGPALDLGCGRGEWLELMREAGIEAIGVEQNPVLAATCRARDLQVVEADFAAFLQQSPPEHWRMVTGFHVVEHLGWPAWYECLRDIHRALGAGGMLILETPNPANLITAANRFYLDPTHRHPIPDALIAFAAKSVGFASVEILPLHPLVEPSSESGAEPAPGACEPAIARAMNGPQDYALIARK